MSFTMPKICNEVFLKSISEEADPERLKKDILFTALVCVMIDNHLLPKVSDTETLDSAEQINFERFLLWKQSSGLYEAQFVMRGFTEISFKLIVIPFRDAVVINTVIDDSNLETYSMCLKVDQYIDLTNPKRFCHVTRLSYSFMNQIISPVKSRILNYFGYPGASLIGLPEDLFLKILLYLPVFDIISVLKTCKRANLLVDNDDFWHKLLIRDHSMFSTLKVHGNWKFKYVLCYIKKLHHGKLLGISNYAANVHLIEEC